MADESRQTRIVVLPQGLLRRADIIVDDPFTSYTSLSDLVEVALRNQLELEAGTTPSAVVSRPQPTFGPTGTGRAADELRAQVAYEGTHRSIHLKASLVVEPVEAAHFADPIAATEMAALTFLTNRLTPVPTVLRVVANIAGTDLVEQRKEVGDVARSIGMVLKELDQSEGRSMAERQAVSWPTGADREKSYEKFFVSYFLDKEGRGALRDLGLARVIDGSAIPTKEGLALARTPIPVVDSPEVLSEAARDLLRTALLSNPAERAVLKVFFDSLGASSGPQKAADAALAEAYGWSPEVAASNRAALVGRLRDLKILGVAGRGPAAEIQVTDLGHEFKQRVAA